MAEKLPEAKIVEALEALTLKAIKGTGENFGHYTSMNDEKIAVEMVELCVKTLAFAKHNL